MEDYPNTAVSPIFPVLAFFCMSPHLPVSCVLSASCLPYFLYHLCFLCYLWSFVSLCALCFLIQYSPILRSLMFLMTVGFPVSACLLCLHFTVVCVFLWFCVSCVTHVPNVSCVSRVLCHLWSEVPVCHVSCGSIYCASCVFQALTFSWEKGICFDSSSYLEELKMTLFSKKKKEGGRFFFGNPIYKIKSGVDKIKSGVSKKCFTSPFFISFSAPLGS